MPDMGVEIAIDKRCQITVITEPEQQFLGMYRTGRIDIKPDPLFVPAAHIARGILVDMTGKITGAVTGFPDHPLQVLQRGDLPVLPDPLAE